ncbi:MAG: hypothetical protein ACE5LU_04860 [Anaerolineae bacterium]
MKARVILLAVLVVAITLVGCVQPQPAAQKEGGAVGGEPVAAGTTRLFSDPQKSNLVYEIEPSGKVFQGSVSQGQTILFFDGRTIFRGASSSGEKLFAVDGARIFVGGSTSGPLAYTVQDGRIFEGSDTGPIIYNWQGERLFQGANPTGDIVFQANRNLEGNVLFLLPILADQRF